MSQKSNISIDDGQSSARYKKCLTKLSKVMDIVQTDEYGGGSATGTRGTISQRRGKKSEDLHEKVMKQVDKIFIESGLKVFSETLMRMMVVPFQVKPNSNQYASRIIQFFFDLITDKRWIDEDYSNSMNSTVGSTVSLLEDGSEPLPIRILKLCERYHQDHRAVVRLRLMETIEKILPDVVEVEKLGRPLQVKLIRMLMLRRKDKNEHVRALALRNLCQLYKEGLPFQNLVEDELLHHMSYDPEPCVRMKVVSNITIYDRILDNVVERTGDPNDSVRAAAIERIAKNVSLRKLPMQLRESILQANTSEDNPKIVQKALNGMLKEWLKTFENDPCEFLRILNVRRRRKLCHSTLDSLYCEQSEAAYEKISKPLLNDKNYPEDSLCVESTFLWLYMYARFHKEPYIMKKLTLPVPEMIEYIVEFVDVVEDEGDLSPSDLAYRSWMLGDMLQILSYLPVEEGERQAVLTFLPQLFVKKKLMDQRNSSLGVKLISVCSNLEEETHLTDLVNTVLDSDRVSSRRSTIRNRTIKADEEDIATLKRELGNLVHRSKKLERERDLASNANDLLLAQQCQDEVKKLETEIEQAKVRLRELEQNESLLGNESQTEDEDEPWPYTDSTMLISIALVKENIQLLNKVSDFSRTFCDLYANHAVYKCKDPAVRALALELMGLVALDHEQEANKATSYCIMALLRDTLLVKVSALRCLFDLVLKYSFSKLAGTPEVQRVFNGVSSIKDVPRFRVDSEDLASTLKTLLLSYIRHDEVALVKVSVAGALKLLFKREMNFSRIVVSFLTHWAIPKHETRLRFQDVGIMIPVYATMGETEAVEVANCLLQCVRKVLEKMYSRASTDEHLPHPDMDQIISLIVKSTHPSKLSNFQRPYIAHQTIAMGALEELRNGNLITDERMHYAKVLKVLELKGCPADSIQQMLDSISNISEIDIGKRVSTILAGFTRHLESLISENGGNVKVEVEPMDTNEVNGNNDIAPGAFDDDNEED